jgi:hypothetical protein
MRGHLDRLVATLGQWVLWVVKDQLAGILAVQVIQGQLAQQWVIQDHLVLVGQAALMVSAYFY